MSVKGDAMRRQIRRSTVLAMALILLGELALRPAVAQVEPAAAPRASASGLTSLSSLEPFGNGWSVLYVEPAAELGEDFVVDDSSRIFVSLVDVFFHNQVDPLRINHVEVGWWNEFNGFYVWFRGIASPEALQSGYLSWLVINDDALPGTPGQACWDLDGDGVRDPEEDRNGDGQVDVWDCQGSQGEPGPQGEAGAAGPQGEQGETGETGPAGPQGEQGEQGDQGPQGEEPGPAGPPGEQGEPGLACWDLDGDGIGDPAEDRNNDGFFNALDCQGQQGTPGPIGPAGPAGPAVPQTQCPEGSHVTGFGPDGEVLCSNLDGTGFSENLPCVECEDVYEMTFATDDEVQLLLTVPPGRGTDVSQLVYWIEEQSIVAVADNSESIFFWPIAGQTYAYYLFASEQCGASPTGGLDYTLLLPLQTASAVIQTADDKRPPTFVELVC
jgi:hypothetical protein